MRRPDKSLRISLLSLSLALSGGLLLAGCEDKPDDVEDVADEVGDAAEDAGDALEDALDG